MDSLQILASDTKKLILVDQDDFCSRSNRIEGCLHRGIGKDNAIAAKSDVFPTVPCRDMNAVEGRCARAINHDQIIADFQTLDPSNRLRVGVALVVRQTNLTGTDIDQASIGADFVMDNLRVMAGHRHDTIALIMVRIVVGNEDAPAVPVDVNTSGVIAGIAVMHAPDFVKPDHDIGAGKWPQASRTPTDAFSLVHAGILDNIALH